MRFLGPVACLVITLLSAAIRGLYIRKYFPPGGGGISADVIWGKNMKRRRENGGKCKRKRKKGERKQKKIEENRRKQKKGEQK
jgi:hypothetical protein